MFQSYGDFHSTIKKATVVPLMGCCQCTMNVRDAADMPASNGPGPYLGLRTEIGQ